MSEADEHLQQFQAADPHAHSIVASSKFVVTYLLEQDGANPGWRKANIEGPLYVVRRRVAPWYQLIVKNKNSQNDLADYLHAGLELDCQKNYIFYKVEDAAKRIRGLWFHDDAERTKVEGEIEKLLEDLRKGPQAIPNSAPPPEASVTVTNSSLRAALHSLADDDNFLGMVMQTLAMQQGAYR